MQTSSSAKSKLSSRQQELLVKRLAERKNQIPRQAYNETAPASLAQNRLWLENELAPDSPTYNIARRLDLNGRLHLPALEQSLNALIDRHEALRTTFDLQEEQIVQKIRPQLLLSLPIHDLTHLSEAEQPEKVELLAKEEARRPFNLTTDPLIRAQLLQLSPQKHTLLFTLHHIIADGWSMNIFIRELAHFYQAYTGDTAPSLPPLPLQYADYAHWQEQQSQDSRMQPQRDYWLRQLSGLPAYLDLPTDWPRPNRQTFEGAVDTFTIPPSLAAPLKAFSRQEDTTLFTTLLAAFNVLLSRYSGQKEIAVGTPVDGRTHPDLENLIGFFVNTVVLRGRLAGNPSFRNFLSQTHQVVLEALSHQELSFAWLVEALKPDRSLNHSPIFQVIFSVQNTPDAGLDLPGLDCDLTVTHSDTAKYDLSLFVKETADALECTWEYNTALFDPETMQRLAANWQTLLTGLIAHPDQPVMDLPLLSAAERQQLTAWNDTRTAYPREAAVHTLFEQQAAQNPQQTALVFAGQQISYGELNRRANQLAHFLRRQGIGPESLVALSIERSVEMIVGMLAILKAGGAYLPLDAAYPAERLAFMLEDGRVSILLTQQSLRDTLPATGQMTILCLDTEWEQVAAESEENPPNTAAPANLAYVMYTSGSTGHPKGVAVNHRSIIRLVKESNYAHLTAAETLLQFAPISFDAATFEIWGSLLNGARLVIAPPHQLALTELADLIQTESVTTLWLTAGLFHLAVDDHLTAFQGVRQLLAGGDVLSPARAQRVLQELPQTRLINGYGPTENTTFTACCPLSPTETFENTVPIGRPLSNTQVYVLDENLQLAPVGVPGELYTGGDGLARGYLNRPKLTAAAFIPHPFAGKPGQRLYRTGDLARWLPDGRLEFLGRRDHQVKIRGYRIEQSEIETILTQHPAVRQSVVTIHTSPVGDKYLAAYVVPEREAIAAADLRQYLTRRLPDYMIPAAWVTMDKFPLNPNGKIDRRALPQPDLSLRPAAAEFAQPTTPTETIMSEIWREVLGLEQIGVHDNFFELGGDSILSIRIVAKAKKAGLSLTMRQLFQHQTIAELAAVIEESETAPLPIETATDELAPLTPIQQWFFERAFARPDHWNLPVLLQLDRPLRREWLEQALAAIIAHHDALTIQFVQTDAGWRQRHAPSTESNWLRWFTGVDNIWPLVIEQQTGLSITGGRLIQVAYFDCGPQPHYLLLIAHHLVMDGISLRILMEDLQTAYTQIEQGTAVTLPAKTTSFHQWANKLSQHAQSSAFQPNLTYWLDNASAPASTIPLDNPAGSNTIAEEAILSYTLTIDETNALLYEVPPAYNTRIDEVLLTALAQAHTAWTGSSSLLLNLEGHGREEILPNLDITRTIGWFTTMYPVRLHLSETRRLEDDLKTIKEQVRQIPDRGITYGLLRYSHPDRALRRRLAQQETAVISFNYLGQFNEQTDPNSLFRIAEGATHSSFAPENQRPHLLDINSLIHKRQLHILLHYSRELHHEQTIARFGDELMRCLRALISHCQSPHAQGYTPSDFDKVTLSQSELDDILADLEGIF